MSEPNKYDRMAIASRCLAGMLASPVIMPDSDPKPELCQHAIEYADTLLALLNEPAAAEGES